MKYAFLLVIFIQSTQSLADASTSSEKIQRISTAWENDSTYYTLENASSVDGCSGSSIIVYKNHPMHDEIFSVALSSFHAGQKVVFRVSGCARGDNMNGIAIKVE